MRIETSYCQQIDDLLAHLLLTVDDAAYHLFLVAVDIQNVEVEVQDRSPWLSCDIHQAVYPDGARERTSDVQVAERYAAHDVLRLHVNLGIVGIAAEDNGASLLEDEVLLDDILNGDVVSSVADFVGSEHVEAAFVVVGGMYVATSAQGDVVAGVHVHKQADGGVGRRIDPQAHGKV